MPHFIQKALTAARGAWMAGPWRALRPLHELGERWADRAAEACREKYPQYYLQGVLGAGVAGVGVAFYAFGTALNLIAPILAAASALSVALPVAGIVALAAGATAAVGVARQSARRTERYFLYEKGLEAMEDFTPPAPTAAPELPQPVKGAFNDEAELSTESAIKALKPIALKKAPEASP